MTRRCLAKKNVAGQGQSEHLNAWAKPCLKKTQHTGSVKTYDPKVYKHEFHNDPCWCFAQLTLLRSQISLAVCCMFVYFLAD